MAGPTELLNEDVKELKVDIREIRSSIDSLKDTVKSEVSRLDVSLARLQTEFSFAKWLLGLLLVAMVTGVCSGIWWASAINTRMSSLEVRFDKFETSIAKVLEQTKPAAK